MSILTADPTMHAALGGLKEKTEIHDAAGNILGYYTPHEVEIELLYQLADKEFNPVEIERELQEKQPVVPHEEVMRYLHSLETR